MQSLIRKQLRNVVIVIMCSAVSASGAPPNLADLQVDHIRLGSDGKLFVQIANQGTNSARLAGLTPPLYLSLGVDHWAAAKINLDAMSNQSFRSVGGVTEVDTGIRLHGSNRRIVAFIDPDNVETELDEFQNTMSMEISAPVRQGFDLLLIAAVDSFDASNDQVYYLIRNVGTQSSPANLPVSVALSIAGTFVRTDTLTVPALAPGAAEFTLYVTNPHKVPPNTPTLVKATLSYGGTFADLDSVNNTFEGRTWSVTLADISTIYGSVLSAVNNGLKWYPPCGGQSSSNPCLATNCPAALLYSQWDQSMRDRLHEFLLLLEQSRPLPVNGRPPGEYCQNNTWYWFIGAEDGEDIYLAHVAQSLWFDRYAVTFGITRRLSDFSTEQLELLLTSAAMIHAAPPSGSQPRYRTGTHLMAANPQVLFRFLTHHQMVRPTQEDTVWALIDWYRAHVLHGSSADPAQRVDYYGYVGQIPADKVIYPLGAPPGLSRHDSPGGCWGTTAFMEYILRTVNIPLLQVASVFSAGPDLCGLPHHAFELPTVRKPGATTDGVIVDHGDNFYAALFSAPFGRLQMPSSRIFYSRQEAETALDYSKSYSYWVPPCPACGDSLLDPSSLTCDNCNCTATQTCNTWVEQRTVNISRFKLGPEQEYRAGSWLLRYYAMGPDHVKRDLFGADAVIEPATQGNGFADTRKRTDSDDEQLRGYGQSVAPSQVIIGPGPDGTLDSTAGDTDGDGDADVTSDTYRSIFACPILNQGQITSFVNDLYAELLNLGSGNFASGGQWIEDRRIDWSYRVAPEYVVPGAPSAPPLAKAGPDQNTCPGRSVTLDGHFSSGPSPLTYLWTSDASLPIAISNPAGVTATASMPMTPGVYTFTLTVFDGANMSKDAVDIHVISPDNAPPLTVSPEGSRYLAITPGGTQSVALRVTQYPNMCRYVQSDGSLGATPYFQTPTAWCTVYVKGTEIIPNLPPGTPVTYSVELAYGYGVFSPPVYSAAWKWGDVDGDGDADAIDIVVVTDAFKGLPVPGSIYRYDLVGTNGGCVPNGIVDAFDITAVVDAVKGFAFPCPQPAPSTCIDCGTNSDCNDAVPCTVDTCTLTGCVHTPNNADCDDAVPCTVDTCTLTGCVHTPNNADCNDAVPCTVDTCTPTGCEHSPNNSDCNDAAPCTVDTCTLTGCVHSNADCSDAVSCTVDTCTPTGCVHTPNNALCPSDGLFCTGTEFCSATLGCADTGNPCPAFQTCDESTDTCSSGPMEPDR
ncbi:MAG: hypothetical protein V1790_05150 [Planctomycetota bacterium]